MRAKQFSSVIVRHKSCKLRFAPLAAILMVVSAHGVSGRNDLVQYRVKIESRDEFCKFIADDPTFEKIVDVK